MENGRVGEGEIGSGDTNIDDTSGEGGKLKAGGHRARRAGGVDDDIGELAMGDLFELGEMRAVGFGEDAGFDAEIISAEIEAALHHVHHDDVHAVHQFEEFQTREADGTRADDEHGFAGFGIASLHGVVADGEGLDEGELIVTKVVSGVELAGGHDEGALAQSAVVVDADDLHARAAV